MASGDARGALSGPLPADFLVLRPHPRAVPPPTTGPQIPAMRPNQVEDVRALQVIVKSATMKSNVGMMPMSCYAQVAIGPNALRTKTLNYCGTSPLWEEVVQFGIRGLNPRRITVEVYAWLVQRPANELHVQVPHSQQPTRSLEDKITSFLGLGQSPPTNPPIMTQAAPPHPPMRPPQNAGLIRVQEVSRQRQADDQTQLKAMFPQFDDDIIASVYGSANGNLDAAAAQLLSLQE